MATWRQQKHQKNEGKLKKYRTNTYHVSHRHEGQVPLDFITVEGQAHVVAQLLQIWVQGWTNLGERRRRWVERGQRKNWVVESRWREDKQVGEMESERQLVGRRRGRRWRRRENIFYLLVTYWIHLYIWQYKCMFFLSSYRDHIKLRNLVHIQMYILFCKLQVYKYGDISHTTRVFFLSKQISFFPRFCIFCSTWSFMSFTEASFDHCVLQCNKPSWRQYSVLCYALRL